MRSTRASIQVSHQLTYTELYGVQTSKEAGTKCKGYFGCIKKNTATSKPKSAPLQHSSMTRHSRSAAGQHIPKPTAFPSPPRCNLTSALSGSKVTLHRQGTLVAGAECLAISLLTRPAGSSPARLAWEPVANTPDSLLPEPTGLLSWWPLCLHSHAGSLWRGWHLWVAVQIPSRLVGRTHLMGTRIGSPARVNAGIFGLRVCLLLAPGTSLQDWPPSNGPSCSSGGMPGGDVHSGALLGEATPRIHLRIHLHAEEQALGNGLRESLVVFFLELFE